MITQEQIAGVIDSQGYVFLRKDTGLRRDALNRLPVIETYATIVTGIRRCGKSTLLLQLLKERFSNAIYLNFEDTRLAGFEISDFARLGNEISKRKINVLFFDEIQIVSGWEMFIHQKLNEGYQIFITGSNASLLSKELGTHLTGRHISCELFPFSYNEFISFKKIENNSDSLNDYLAHGGIPEYVKSGMGVILNNLMDDILIRDIAIRHSIRDVNSLRQLAVYLISNIGNLVSANKLEGMYGIKSSSTILEYFSYLKDSYLLEFIPQFNYSLKAQARNPKKIYAMDLGLFNENSTAFTDNSGHKLENAVFLYLRSKYPDIYYFKDKGECDFIAMNKGKVQDVIQVCYKIEDTNFEREYNGLVEAMKYFNINEGTIVTFNQKDIFEESGLKIKMIPATEFLQ